MADDGLDLIDDGRLRWTLQVTAPPERALGRVVELVRGGEVRVTASGAGWCTLARLDSGVAHRVHVAFLARDEGSDIVLVYAGADATSGDRYILVAGLGVVALALWTLARSPLGALILLLIGGAILLPLYLDPPTPAARAAFTAMATEVERALAGDNSGAERIHYRRPTGPDPPQRRRPRHRKRNVAVCNSVVMDSSGEMTMLITTRCG